MNNPLDPNIGRRRVLLVLAAGAAGAAPLAAIAAQPQLTRIPRARYQADSPEVQTFYRVNRYPPK
jgi:hypothetical protein